MKKIFLICCALFTCLLTYSHAENILETEGQETSVPDVETMPFLSGIDILDSNMWDIEPNGVDEEGTPPYYFYYKNNLTVRPTFFKQLNLQTGNYINLTLDNGSGNLHVMVFNTASPQSFSHIYYYDLDDPVINASDSVALSYMVPANGNYAVLICSDENATTCDISLNGISYTNQIIN